MRNRYLLSVVPQALGAGVAYLAQFGLARMLTPGGFGHVSAILSVTTISGLIGTLGISGYALRVIPPLISRGASPDVARHSAEVFSVCLAGGSTIGLFVAAITFFLNGSSSVPLAVLVGALSFAVSMTNFGSDLGRALNRYNSTYVVALIGKPSLLAAALALAAVSGWYLDVPRALVLIIFATVVPVLFQFLVVGSTAGIHALRPHLPRMSVALRGPSYLLASGLAMLLSQVDLLAVAAVLQPTDLGCYAAAAKAAGVLSLVTVGVNSVLIPRVAAARRDDLQRTVTGAVRINLGATMALSLPLLVAPGTILSVFGAGYVRAAPALVAVALGQLVNAACGSSGVLLTYTDHQGRAVLGFAVSLAGSAVLCVFGALTFGLMGAAIASGLSSALTGIVFATLARRTTGIRTAIA